VEKEEEEEEEEEEEMEEKEERRRRKRRSCVHSHHEYLELVTKYRLPCNGEGTDSNTLKIN